jgi:hypothetical protein
MIAAAVDFLNFFCPQGIFCIASGLANLIKYENFGKMQVQPGIHSNWFFQTFSQLFFGFIYTQNLQCG